MAALKAKGQVCSLDVYHMLRCGAVTGNPDSTLPDVTEVQQAAAETMIGMFGGGPRFIRGALKVQGGFPLCPATVKRGIVGEHALMTQTDRLSMPQMFRRVDDVLGWLPMDIDVLGDNYAEQVAAWMTENTPVETAATVDEDANSVSDEKEARGLKTFSGYEVVMPGTSFEMRFAMHDAREAQAGLLVSALVDLFNRPELGGKSGIGCGEYAVAECTIEIDGKRHKMLADRVAGSDYTLDMDSSAIAEIISALKESMAVLDVKDLTFLSRRPASKEEKEVTKQAKSTKKANKTAATA
jgi:CRISPR type IV-associated protein Csf2